MTLYFGTLNLAEGMGNVLWTPLVLAFAPPTVLGAVMSAAGSLCPKLYRMEDEAADLAARGTVAA